MKNIYGRLPPLVSPTYQKNTLDEFAQIQDQIETLQKLWEKWQKLINELDILKQAQSQISERKETLNWKLKELENLSLEAEEWNKLSSDQKRVGQISELLSTLSRSREHLESDTGIIRTIEVITSEIRHLGHLDSSFNEICDLLEKGMIELKEASIAIKKCEKNAEIDEEQASQINQRFNDVMNLWLLSL